MTSYHKSAPRAFTLIELLVVVAIIALLISILLPSLSKARDTARTVACGALVKQYGLAKHMYADAYDGYFPAAYSTPPNREFRWFRNTAFREMMSMQDVTGATGLSDENTTPSGFLCPSAPDVEHDLGHLFHVYGTNRVVPPADRTPIASVHRASVIGPSQKLQMTDATEYWVGDFRGRYDRWWDVHGDRSVNQGGAVLVAYRHSEGANFLHFDGHVEHYAKEQAYPADVTEMRDMWYIYEHHRN